MAFYGEKFMMDELVMVDLKPEINREFVYGGLKRMTAFWLY